MSNQWVELIQIAMFKGIGFLIMLWAVSLYFGPTIKAFNQAAVATFSTIEVAAEVSEKQLRAAR